MAALSSLTDNFATQDLTKWRDHTLGTGSWNTHERITSGQLEIDCNSAYNYLESVNTFDLTNSAAYVEVVQRPAQGGDNSTEMYFIVGDGTNNVYFILTGGGGITWNHDSGGYTGTDNFATYDPVSMKILRIRHNGTNVLLETAPSVTGTFTTRGTYTATGSITALRPQFQCGYYGTQASPGSAKFDNFNVDPNAVVATDTKQFFSFFGA